MCSSDLREDPLEKGMAIHSRILARRIPQTEEEAACDVVNWGWIPGLGRSLGEGNGNPLQSSYLGYPMDRGAWWATVHGVAKSWI